MDENMDEDAQLAAAIALSNAPMDDAMDEDEEAQLAAAIALSQAPEAAPAPAAASGAALLEKAGFEARVKELFAAAVGKGRDANEAAAEALKQAQREQLAAAQEARKARAAAAEGGDAQVQLSARVRVLFDELTAGGMSPNEAAAKALEQASTELKQQPLAAPAASAAKAAGQEGDSKGESEADPLALVPQLSQRVEKFERWEEIEKVNQAQVDTINNLYREEGITFVDPSWAPSPKALYATTESATTWKCRSCGKRSPLPPAPSERELMQMMFDRSSHERLIRCGHCGVECNELEVALRPTDWFRPAELRDDVTMQFSTVPWVVIRDEPRPDDIRQGHVGNCWLVCAMSALAEDPANVRKLLLTSEYNHAGVYQVKLCLNGVWHCAVIDDAFPTTSLRTLAYLKAARRSLWGPLIEKAAAKLHGSYEALNGGTFAEAFGLLTGYPVQRIHLGRYKPPKPPEGSVPSHLKAQVDQLLDDGSREAVDSLCNLISSQPADPQQQAAAQLAAYKKRLELWKGKRYDMDELYAQIFSYKETGFVIGCSTFFVTEAEITTARSVGIQVPHAYCLLQLTVSPDDAAEPLVKLRNPNGHAGWRGKWSKGSAQWTYEAREELRIEQEDSGVFWMTWADFTTYFAEITVCRLMPDYMEAREGGWLPSVFGAGQAVAIEVYAHTKLELTLHQEAHSNRGENAIHTQIDLGAVVMRVDANGVDANAPAGDVLSPSALVAHGERSPTSSVSLDTTLENDGSTSRYMVLPMCLGHFASVEPRKFVAACHTNHPVSMEVVPLPPAMLASALIAMTLQKGEKQTLLNHPMLGPALNIYTYEEEAGYILIAENTQPLHIRVEVDASEGRGFISSRSAPFCEDVLPPRSRMVIMALSIDMSVKAHSLSLRYGGGALEPGTFVPEGSGHIPALEGPLAEVHKPQPMEPSGGGGFGGFGGAPPPGGVDISALASSIMSQMR